jgi:hypothetical protein
MVDIKQVETAVTAKAQELRAWYKNSTFWGQAAAGALIYQALRLVVWHFTGLPW